MPDIQKTSKLLSSEDILACPAESLPENPILRRILLRMLFDRTAASKDAKKIKKNAPFFKSEAEDYVSSCTVNIEDMEILGILASAGYEIRNRDYIESMSLKSPQKNVRLMIKYYGSSKTILPYVLKYSSYIDDSSLVRILLKNPSYESADAMTKLGRIRMQAEFVKSVLDSDSSVFVSYSDSIEKWLTMISEKDFVKRIALLSPDTVKTARLAYQRGRVHEEAGELMKAYESYMRASDYEAVVRIIAKIYDRGGRKSADSLLTGLETENEIVRYHKGKLLIMRGRKEEGMKILSSLAEERTLSYYSVRAAVLCGGDTFSEQQPASPDSILEMLYDTMKALSASKYFNSFAFLACSEKPSLRAVFARLYSKKGEYNLSIHFAQYINDSTLSFEEKVSLMFPEPYCEIFRSAADSYGLDPAILFAIGREESSFNPNAVSSVGAKGVMQLMDFVYDSYYTDRDYFNLKNNIFGGAKHISIYMKQFPDNYAYAVMSYNAGGGNASKWKRSKADWEIFNETIPFYETRNFVRKVLRSYYVYKFFRRVS